MIVVQYIHYTLFSSPDLYAQGELSDYLMYVCTSAGADKYIFEALALGQVAQQNLLALPSNLLALL